MQTKKEMLKEEMLKELKALMEKYNMSIGWGCDGDMEDVFDEKMSIDIGDDTVLQVKGNWIESRDL